MKWRRMEQGTPIASRLDFGVCSVRLRVPAASSAAVGEGGERGEGESADDDRQQIIAAGARVSLSFFLNLSMT